SRWSTAVRRSAGRACWAGWAGSGGGARPAGAVRARGRGAVRPAGAAGRGGRGAGLGGPGRPVLALGGRSPPVATAQRDQGLVGTPGPGGPLLLAHNDPRSVSRSRGSDVVRMRILEGLCTCDF